VVETFNKARCLESPGKELIKISKKSNIIGTQKRNLFCNTSLTVVNFVYKNLKLCSVFCWIQAQSITVNTDEVEANNKQRMSVCVRNEIWIFKPKFKKNNILGFLMNMFITKMHNK
jgi:hypothetical protein